MLEEAAKRDHRKIGQEQELFFFHQMSPGAAFFLPHGMIIYNALQSYIRDQYWQRGYQEVNSPNMYSSALWKQSGKMISCAERILSKMLWTPRLILYYRSLATLQRRHVHVRR